jgi:hypothetical protein
MTETFEDLYIEFDRLTEIAATAEETYRAAKDAADRAAAGAFDHPAVAALRNHEDGRIFHKPSYRRADERKLVTRLCEAIIADPDLNLTSIGASRFRVDDVGPARREREARTARDAALRERNEYLAEHRLEFEAAEEVARNRAFREAIDEADTDALKELLCVGSAASNALTTSDLG